MPIMSAGYRKMTRFLFFIGAMLAFQSAFAGEISGRVTDEDSGDPLAGINVAAYCWNGWWWDYTSSSITDSSGNYRIEAQQAGAYRVKFTDYSEVYIDEVYAGFQGIWPDEGGTDITVPGSGAAVTGIDAALELGSAIEGQITAEDDGTPLAGINVHAYRWDGSWWSQFSSSITDSSGNYSLRGLRPGTYRVEFCDYWGPYIDEVYSGFQGIWPGEGGTDILVPGGGAAVTGINAALEIGSAIEGKVTTEDGGTPLAEINVTVYRWDGSSWEWISSSSTDHSGNYRIEGLLSGTYRVEFCDYWGTYIDEVYAGFQGIWSGEGGTDIVVPGGGATVAGIDATLETYATISGTVTAVGNGELVAGVRVYLHDTDLSAVTDDSGRYTIRYVLPGTYALHANPHASTGLLGAWYGGALYTEQRMPPDGSTMVTASSGQSVSGVDFSLEQGGQVAGVVLSGSSPLEGVRITIFNTEFETHHRSFSDDSGNYTLMGLLPGTYLLKAEADGFGDQWWDGGNHQSEAVPFSLGIGDMRECDFDLFAGQNPALVEVTSDPPGAEIYLDYHPTGEVTPAVIDVGEIGSWDAQGNRLASHVITLKQAGMPQPVPRPILPVEAETTVEHFDLTGDVSGSVMIETEPAGADVYVDYADEAFGVTPLLVENLAPGSHTILLRKEGYLRPRPVTVQVAPSVGLAESSQVNSFSVLGTPQGWHADDDCWEIDLPFAFPFYGFSRTNLYVSSNGTLAFDGPFDQWWPDSTTLQNREMIAVLWDDLRTYEPDDILLLGGVDTFTVVWNARRYSGYSEAVRISATLHADGRIELKYGDGNAQGGMIGVSAGDGTSYAFSSRSQSGSMNLVDDIVFEPVDTIVGAVRVPLSPVGAGPEIAVEVSSPAVPDMLIYVDYLPTEQVTDAVVGGLDPASHAGGSGGATWSTASHTILLRKPGIRPFAPRIVDSGTNTLQTLIVQPWMTDLSSISLAEALDTEGTLQAPVWSTGPQETPWTTVSEVDGNGEDAAVSGVIGHSASSWLMMSVTNSGTLTFDWRVSCQTRYDYLFLTVDGVVQGRLSGESGWQTKTVEMDGDGEHEVVWTYVKDGSITGGQDCAWVDQVVWTPDPLLTLEEALDTTNNLVWHTDGDVPWHPVTEPSHDGEDAARSGAIGDYGISTLATTVTGPGDLQFYWKVSSEEWADWLDFMIDDELVETISGETDWIIFSTEIGPGEHTLAWEYWKNESVAAGDDAGFLDQVLWLPHAASGSETITTPVPVPFAWLDGYPGLLDTSGGDYEAAALSLTGKRDSSGHALAVWQDYVAGTCPTNLGSQFKCSIEMNAGRPVLFWEPDLGNERIYTIWGRPNLLNGDWMTPTNEASRFYKVEVSLP